MTDLRADASDVRQDLTEDNVTALRAEVAELKAGTLGLTNQVESLSGALSTMNTLQMQQREQAVQLAEVKQVVVPREELQQEQRRLREDRRHATWLMLIFMLIFVLVAAYIAIWLHEIYRDSCHLERPAAWCDNVFPFDGDGLEPPVHH